MVVMGMPMGMNSKRLMMISMEMVGVAVEVEGG